MTYDTRRGHGERKARRGGGSRPSSRPGRLAARLRALSVVICCALALQPSLIAPGPGHAREAARVKSSAGTENSLPALAARSLAAFATAFAGGLGSLAHAGGAEHRAPAAAGAAFEPEPAAAVVFLDAPAGLSVASTSDSQIVLS